MEREVFFPFPILSGLVNATFWLRGLREQGKQSVGKAILQLPLSSAPVLPHGCFMGSWLAEDNPYFPLPSIYKTPECLGFLLPGENSPHCTPGEKTGEGEGDSSRCTLWLPWLRGSLAHPRLIFGIIRGFLNLA